MNFLEFDHPFYAPLWRRIVIVGLLAGWAIFEFVTQAPFWGVLFAGGAVWAFIGLILRPRNEVNGKK